MSLKKKLILTNVGIVVTFGLILFLQFNKSLIGQRSEIRKGFQENSEKISNNLIQKFYFYYHNIQAIAKNSSLKTNKFEENNFLLNELISLYPSYKFMLLTDLEGNYISSNSMDSKGKKLYIEKLKSQSFKNKKWFFETKSGKLTEDFKKNIFGSRFGSVINSSIGQTMYGDQVSGFHISTIVQDEYGDPQAILTSFLSSAVILEEVESLKSNLKMKNATVKIFDESLNSLINASEETISKDQQLNIQKKIEAKQSVSLFTIFSDDSNLVAFTKISNKKFLDVLGWQVYVEINSSNIFSSINNSKLLFSISFIVCLIVASLLSLVISSKLSSQVSEVSKTISLGVEQVNSTTEDIRSQASRLSDSTNEQASSLQETVSSLTEISAMVSKNTSHSQSSKELSLQSRNSANLGVKTIEEMMLSIEDISETNLEIINQMNKNSQEMNDITKVISDIEEKTKVINDIVFQTKLLSFNASVEAARAGEHGKGFSVVAEEVGNLAKNSGEAAKEIEELLVTSISRVNTIVNSTKDKVDSLISKGTDKVATGKSVATKCKKALEEILGHSVELDQAIEEIATASVEQSRGIDEIANAMEQLDVVTRKNSEIAKVVSSGTHDLAEQSDKMKLVSRNLSSIIYGKGFIVNDTIKTVSEENVEKLSSKVVEETADQKEAVVEKSQHDVENHNINSESKKASSSIDEFDDAEWEDI